MGDAIPLLRTSELEPTRTSGGVVPECFVSNESFGTQILVRDSWSKPFVAPAASAPPMSAWRITPLADCSALIGTSEPGGCDNERLSIWSRH
jgi:hypothetical protein